MYIVYKRININVHINVYIISHFRWSKTTPRYRSQILRKIADIIEMYSEEFASMESRDQGKPISLAKTVDIPRCILNFRFFASVILHDINE